MPFWGASELTIRELIGSGQHEHVYQHFAALTTQCLPGAPPLMKITF
jgi:hypothetical protein